MPVKVMKNISSAGPVSAASSWGSAERMAYAIPSGMTLPLGEGPGAGRRMRSSNDATVWWFISSGLFLFLAVAASAQSGDSAPRLEAIVAGMAQGRAENQARLRPYVVTRVYVLSGKKKDKTKSEVTAEIAFTPPNFKKYSIRESNGSGLGERLVRRILEAETQIVKDYGTTDISPAN